MKLSGCLVCSIMVLLLYLPVNADEIAGIRAYPVPYNPQRQTLTVADTRNRYVAGQTSIVMEIMDFNGDRVYKRSFSSFPIKWKGYSTNGERVENGLYFIKMTIEDLESGEVKKGLLRIIIKK